MVLIGPSKDSSLNFRGHPKYYSETILSVSTERAEIESYGPNYEGFWVAHAIKSIDFEKLR